MQTPTGTLSFSCRHPRAAFLFLQTPTAGCLYLARVIARIMMTEIWCERCELCAYHAMIIMNLSHVTASLVPRQTTFSDAENSSRCWVSRQHTIFFSISLDIYHQKTNKNDELWPKSARSQSKRSHRVHSQTPCSLCCRYVVARAWLTSGRVQKVVNCQSERTCPRMIGRGRRCY